MRKWTMRLVIALGIVLLVAQVIPVTRRTNPPVDPARTLAAQLPVPGHVSAVLQRACRDCHSHETIWPWYSQVAPVSWLVIRHVNEGRRELNLSVWGQYEARRQVRKLKEICDQVRTEKMPISSYLLLHPKARLSEQERSWLCEWTETIRERLAGVGGKASPSFIATVS